MAQTDNNGIIYLEVDEDITSAIDKLTKNSSDTVQVVTAKRSTLFQSVINMKLLKKAAADNKKVLTLVTGDRVATNLAGRIGVPVAERVGEPGRVPSSSAPTTSGDDEIDGGTVDAASAEDKADSEPDEPKSKPEPAKAAPLAAAAAAAPAKAAEPVAEKAAKAAKPAKTKSAVPNIGIMQKRVLWIAGGIFAILLLFGLNYYFTKATVSLYARGTQVNAAFKFTADPSAQISDIDSGVLAASPVTATKTLKGTVTATGTKDNGTKAKGTMTVYNSYDSSPHQLVAGTRFVANGKTFRSTSDVTVPGGSVGGGKIQPGQVSVQVEAAENGDSFNLGPTRYSIPGLPADQQAEIYGQGQQMSGGTSKISKIITQGDIDKAKQAAVDADKPEGQKLLSDKVDDDQILLDASIQQNVTKVDASPEANSEANNGTVSVEVAYTGLAVRKSDLSALTKAEEQKQVGEDKEIYEDGSDKLALTLEGKPDTDGAQRFNARAAAFAGAKIDKEQLAKEMKGKKVGDAVEIGNQQPDVERTEIKVSPGWATSLPGIVKHITIEIKVSGR